MQRVQHSEVLPTALRLAQTHQELQRLEGRHGEAAIHQSLPTALREAKTLQQLQHLKILLGEDATRRAWQQLTLDDRKKLKAIAEGNGRR